MCVCVWWAGRGEVIQKAPGGTLETYKHVDQASWVVLAVTSPPANAGDIRDTGLIPGSGRAVGGEHSNPLQYSCLKNPHGQRSLEGYSPRSLKESDMTEQRNTAQSKKTRNVQACSLLSLSSLFSGKGKRKTHSSFFLFTTTQPPKK